MHRLLRLVRNPWLVGVLATVALYSILGFLAVPYLIRHYVPKSAAELIKCQASIGEVRFDPFRFVLEAKDLALKEADGKPVAAVGRLLVDFELSALITRQVFAFRDFRLEQPTLNLVVDPDGKLNLAKISEALPKSREPEPAPTEEPPPKILLEHIALAGGSVRFNDRSAITPIDETVKNLNLELTGIATLPDRQGAYQFAAALPDGGEFSWRGEMSLNPIASSGDIKLAAQPIKSLWSFMRDRIDLAEPGGRIDFSAHYQFSYPKKQTRLEIDGATFKLTGIRLAGEGAKQPLVALQEIGFEQATLDLATRTVRVPSFAIRKGEINAATDEQGRIDWLRLVKQAPQGQVQPLPAAKAQPASPEPEPWKIMVEKFQVAELALRYADASRRSPFAALVGDFGLDFGAEVSVGAGAAKGVVQDLAVHVDRVALAEPEVSEPLLHWDSFRLEGGRLDLEKREAGVKRLVLKGGGTGVERGANGALRPIDGFAPKQEPAREPVAAPTSTAAPAATPSAPSQGPGVGTSPAPVAKRDESAWRYAIDEVALEDFGVALTDYSQPSKLAYNFDGIRVLVKNITNDGKTPIAVDARLNVREGGSLQMSATAPQTFDAAQAKIQLDRFDLRQLQPFLSQYAALKLGGADLSAEMAVDFRQANPQPSVKAAGNVRLDGLSLKEIKEDRKFLAWKSLALNGLNLTLAPDKLTIKEIRIVRPDATVSIYKDRSTNIAAIFKTQRTNGAAPAAQPAKGAPAAGATGSKRDGTKPFPVTVERVRIDDGLVDFSDLSLVIPFATKIHDFHGSASGISMTPKNRASMKFSGRVGQFGETKVDGSLSPMQVLDFADVNVTFRNVAMSDLSPYSATFAGRAIKSGKLNLDLLYKIQGRQLKSQNKVELQDFTLGDAVESPNSTNLPLDLAIALLTDSQGKISASVPIEGTVDDPKFDYGALVWDAFVKLITNVVSAPFNAVAAMFGDGEQHYDAILFEPGKAALPPPEREKLLKIAGALQSRPKLKLVVHGHYDSTRDGDAMKSLKLRRELAEQLDTALAPGEEPDAVAYGDAAAQRALEKMAEASAGSGVLEAALGDYLKQTGKPAQRVGKFAGLMGQPSETPDFYEMLFKRMIAAAPLAQADLETLAQRRSKAVLDELVQRRRIEPSRITEGKAEPTDRGTEQGVPSGLELVAE